ncbi:MarR family transcriptional regulator [uncultured Propionibacterium sp.]|uniref:MarR family winged helix-turn-helix transcriptional regulator n=1 Tax=uncultured Propionibacterium sp. TaxID=218066 RepID=UPI00292F371E|nr:MarR family transcriptional regulator [uncultured Propionibacterium sp.]
MMTGPRNRETPASGLDDWPAEPPAFALGLQETGSAGPLLRAFLAAAPWDESERELPEEILPLIVTTMIGVLGGLLRRRRDRLAEEEWGMSSSRVGLLMAVARLGSPTMSELARALSVTPRAVTRLVDGLEADGHVVRERQEADGRVIRVSLTDEALARVVTMGDAHLERITELSAGIDAEDQRAALRVLRALDYAVRTELGLE